MEYVYYPQGVCSQEMRIVIENGIVTHVSVKGGCNGNLQGICRFVEGSTPKYAISKMKGIKCGFKPTSCPDQMATALELAIAQQEQ